MLNDSLVTANVPASDLARAKRFYADVLGLTPASENPGGLVYTTRGGTTFFVYETEYAGQSGHTIAQWHVANVADEVRELKATRGSRTARATSCASTTRPRVRPLLAHHHCHPEPPWVGALILIAHGLVLGRGAPARSGVTTSGDLADIGPRPPCPTCRVPRGRGRRRPAELRPACAGGWPPVRSGKICLWCRLGPR